MPEAKKNAKPQPRTYASPLDSQINSVRLVAAQNAQSVNPSAEDQPGEPQTPPPALVSKLIDFIKKI